MGYDPTVGSWIEADPADYIDGPNRYQMERGNPGRYVDPSGLDGQLPDGVNPPGSGAIVGPISNDILQLIQRERNAVPRSADSIAALRDLIKKQSGYKCKLTIKSITYVGSEHVVKSVFTDRATANGGVAHILTVTSYDQDKFQVKATVESNCGVKGGDVTYTTIVVRNQQSNEIGPSRPPGPPSRTTPIPGPAPVDVPVPPGTSGGTVTPGGFDPPTTQPTR